MSRVVYDFTGERFVVTGASSGMGRQVALELAEAGAEVLAIGRNESRLESLRSECPERIFTDSLDVCNSDSLEGAIAGFVSSHGKLDGGVHAAGIDALTPLRTYDDETARKIMEITFWAGMKLLQLITKAKYGNAGTSTVFFSSVASLTHDKGKFAYSAAKAAVNAAVSCAAKEICAKKHRVNSVLPGWVATPMTETLGEVNDSDSVISRHLLGTGKPEDVSKVVLFLLSDASGWITGTNLVIDGGYSA